MEQFDEYCITNFRIMKKLGLTHWKVKMKMAEMVLKNTKNLNFIYDNFILEKNIVFVSHNCINIVIIKIT